MLAALKQVKRKANKCIIIEKRLDNNIDKYYLSQIEDFYNTMFIYLLHHKVSKIQFYRATTRFLKSYQYNLETRSEYTSILSYVDKSYLYIYYYKIYVIY